MASITVPLDPGHYVYIHRDEHGRVLYVGRTSAPLSRLANHQASRTRSPWFPQVRQIDWELCSNETSAWLQEMRLIEALAPPFNKDGVRPPRPRRAARLRDQRRRLSDAAPASALDLEMFKRMFRRSPQHVVDVLDACSRTVA
jgi:predicted GIY-YIG superfamily endonuclease